MSRIWAICDENTGIIVSSVHQDRGGLVHGGQYGEGYVARDVSNTNWRDFNDMCYWHNENECWEALPPRPEGNYKFENHEWTFDADAFAEILRSDRDAKLQMSDWTQVPDSPLSAAKKADWADYRQALRDLPANIPSDVHSIYAVVWPTEPS